MKPCIARTKKKREFHPADGFTIVELLVVMAIVGLLLAILLPAVQGARESARRTDCISRLKQLGVALQNYHDAQRSLPPGYVSGFTSAGDDTGPGWGWAAFLLPQLEQRPAFDSIQFVLPIEDSANARVRMLELPVFLCPSDSRAAPWWAWTRDPSNGEPIAKICQVGPSNYVGMYGDSEPGVDGNGLFFRNSGIRLGDITDGLSQTIAVGERSHDFGEATWVGSVTDAVLFPGDGDAVGYARPENSTGMVLGHAGEGFGPGDPNADVNQFYSRHGQGVNFLFADGHVRYLPVSTNYRSYLAMSTRAAGDVVAANY
jgi:prepilin-type processing-associated H-X9-DG protein/prepilin-type N-terminal cleavage/methylation domain-containing protein